jgi:Ca2+-binding RTX toxin-like protein
VTLLDDAILENLEAFTITLSAPANATIADGLGIGRIIDNETSLVYAIGEGNRVVSAGPGLDTLVVNGEATIAHTVLLTSIVLAGEGNDRIDGKVDTISRLDIDGVENLIYNAGNAGDTLDVDGNYSDTDLALGTGFVFNGGTGVDKLLGDGMLSLHKFKAFGAGGNDTLSGGAGDDSLDGGEGQDVIAGFSGNDWLIGGGGNDVMYGDNLSLTLTGNDILDGGAGNDRLIGGKGVDTLTGGLGNDTYVFNTTGGVIDTGIGAGSRDVINDFEAAGTTVGDIINLAAIVADTVDGVFAWNGSAAFSGVAGQLRVVSDGGTGTLVQGETTGDGIADFEIQVLNVAPTAFDVTDFVM